jgi:hypothetical protein
VCCSIQAVEAKDSCSNIGGFIKIDLGLLSCSLHQ